MSVCNEDGEKVDLPTSAGHIYHVIGRDWAGEDPNKWRGLVMLFLIEVGGFTEWMVALAFDVHQTTVHRTLEPTRKALANLPELIELLAQYQESQKEARRTSRQEAA